MADKDRIRELAVKFRKAILKCDRMELPLSLADFPTGSCADASLLVGSYFKDNGINGFVLIKGKRGEGSSLETHYWIEKNEVLVDITAIQFGDTKEEVVIDKTDSGWYGTFKKEILQEADYRAIAARDVKRHLEAVYEYVLEHIND